MFPLSRASGSLLTTPKKQPKLRNKVHPLSHNCTTKGNAPPSQKHNQQEPSLTRRTPKSKTRLQPDDQVWREWALLLVLSFFVPMLHVHSLLSMLLMVVLLTSCVRFLIARCISNRGNHRNELLCRCICDQSE